MRGHLALRVCLVQQSSGRRALRRRARRAGPCGRCRLWAADCISRKHFARRSEPVGVDARRRGLRSEVPRGAASAYGGPRTAVARAHMTPSGFAWITRRPRLRPSARRTKQPVESSQLEAVHRPTDIVRAHRSAIPLRLAERRQRCVGMAFILSASVPAHRVKRVVKAAREREIERPSAVRMTRSAAGRSTTSSRVTNSDTLMSRTAPSL